MTHGDPSREGRHGDIGLETGRQGLDTLELYDVFKDPHELHNKRDDYPEIVGELTDQIEKWWSD
jgi:arylsulfatase A-like enzyme